MNADDTIDRTPRITTTRCAAAVALAAFVALACGCLASPRHEYLSMRGAAPRPERAAGATLAEAATSNVGPSRPPAALAGRADR